jgi:lipoate-protein ligase B
LLAQLEQKLVQRLQDKKKKKQRKHRQNGKYVGRSSCKVS